MKEEDLPPSEDIDPPAAASGCDGPPSILSESQYTHIHKL